MIVALGTLLLSLTPAPPPPDSPTVGSGKNGVPVAALPSSSPWAAAALALRLPAGASNDDAHATLPLMAAAATAALGREAGPERPGSGVEVELGPDRIALVAVVPAASADLAVRAVDAALKSLRAAPPRQPAPLPMTVGGHGPLPPGGSDVAAAMKRLATIDASHVAVAVIAPGPDPLRRSSALLTAPLARPAPAPAAPTTPTAPTPPTPPTTAPDAGWRLAAPTPVQVAAVFVLGALVDGRVRRDADGLRLEVPGVADGGRAMLEGVAATPPPLEVVQDAAARRRLDLALPLADVPALARRLADDLLDDPGHDEADASLAVIDGFGNVTPAELSRAAAALIAAGAP